MPSEAPICRAALNQANVRWPGRLKTSDGIMSSDAHKKQNPRSDHDHGNAVDITHYPASGPDCSVLAKQLVERAKAGHAPWVKYVIFNNRIASEAKAWAWRAYGGVNPHKSHMHVSIKKEYRDADVDWWDPPTPAASTQEDDDMTPEQDKRLKNVEQLLMDLVRPRRADKKDHDPRAVDLGDILTMVEKDDEKP